MTTTTCPTCNVALGGEGKHLHRCDVRGVRGQLISREWVGYYDGTAVCYKDDQGTAERVLDEYVYDLLSDGLHLSAAQLDGGSDVDAMAAEVVGMVVAR